MNRLRCLICLVAVLIGCAGSDPEPEDQPPEFISAVDISQFPKIEESGAVFFNSNGQEQDFLLILKESGINTIRLKLWVNPENKHAGFDEVNVFSQRLRQMNFKIWLTVHYSDTWADPGHQVIPAQWQGSSFSELKDHVGNYTKMIAEHIQPDIIQIGNEINPGFLLPEGSINNNREQFNELMQAAIESVRTYSPDSKIMIHYAGIDGSNSFFSKMAAFDYDIIGLSYYPKWHGKDLDVLQQTMAALARSYIREIVVAETAYPFTLEWNDWTNNIIGSEDQILSVYPASPKGQADFIKEIRSIVEGVGGGIGFCYWGAELVAWKGPEANDGSPWENQALFDFENGALPVLEEFQ